MRDQFKARRGASGPPPESLDQLRERLRALGYLDAPVDRYVLGSGSSRAGATRFALGAGLRVGIVAGLLLGISAAIALAARAPGLIATRRDAVVLAGALSLLFAVITAAAVAGTAIAAGWYAARTPRLTPRRARAVAAVAGILVALASAAYLTLWWDAAQDVLTSLTFGWNAAALGIAAAIALLVAHAVSVVILAALARSHADAGIAAGGLLSSRAFLAGFGALLFAGSVALLGYGASRDSGAAAAPITVVPTGYALRVVAIDGFDVQVGERLTRDGSLPAFSRLLQGGRLTLPSTGGAPDPARDWTTIATGQPSERHGITALEGRRAFGIEGRLLDADNATLRTLLSAADLLRLTTPAIATGEQRRVPAFWEVASAAGLRTAVVNWWATWPAPAGDDIVITDRALLRLDTGGALDAEIAPPALYDTLGGQWAGMRRAAADAAASAFASIADDQLRRVMVRSAELDLLVARIAETASPASGPPLDLIVIYLPGLDIAQHSLLQAQGGASVSALSARIAALESYYRFLDDLVGRMTPPSARHVDAAILWTGRVHGARGQMVLSGGPVIAGTAAGNGAHGEAAATLLYLLGLPLAGELQPAHGSIVTPAFLSSHPIRRIANYDAARVARGQRTGQPLDAEALERLRSLGYIR